MGGERQAMADPGALLLQVSPDPQDDAEELATLTGLLRNGLLDLDVSDVERLPDGLIPPGAKGVAAVAGWLAVRLGSESLRAVLVNVADWVTRNDRMVVVSYGHDTLRLSRATRQQQEKIIDDWLTRHPAKP
jgi:hypothetical protein